MAGGSESPKPAIYDAASYLRVVNDALQDEPAKHNAVIKIFADFLSEKVTIKECVIRLAPLLEDHPDLLRGFKFFHPRRAADEAEAEAEAEAEEHINAMTFAMDVKKQLHDEPAIYEEFVKLMKDYKADRIDDASVQAGVFEIIKDHQNLVLSYNACIPAAFHITIPNNAEQQTEPLDKKD